MKVCVLQPDYSSSEVDYRHYDPPRDLGPLLPECRVESLLLRKSTVYRQLRQASRQGYDIFVNLCEGYLDWDIPSIDVIWSLDLLNLPYTGPCLRLYDPSKLAMKFVAMEVGVDTPAFVEVIDAADCRLALESLRFPLFVKPAHSGDSLGVDEASLVTTPAGLESKCSLIWQEHGPALVEEFIAGREATVLMAASPQGDPLILHPIEFLFADPQGFKTYSLKVTEHHPESNRPIAEAELVERLREAAARIFAGFQGEGYARLDFRIDGEGRLYFLEINFACSIFYPPGYEGSADYVLGHDRLGPGPFLRHLIAEGLDRHRRRQPKLRRRADGYYALAAIAKGENLPQLGRPAERDFGVGERVR